MTVKVGQQYKKKSKVFTIKKVDSRYQFTYITVLQDGLKDTYCNHKIFGILAFEAEFNLIKGGENGRTETIRTWSAKWLY